MLDCEESSLNERLRQRYARLNRVEDQESVAGQRILFFKYCTLPVVRHYDERSKLVTVSFISIIIIINFKCTSFAVIKIYLIALTETKFSVWNTLDMFMTS
ncbi:unnamed protein product [Trichobilharzia regenti]|nr:unnamed protein product [Trichobilharzia regenti]